MHQKERDGCCPRRLPLFFDLVSDSTRSRLLSVLVVLFVLNVVLYVVMSAVLRDPRRNYGATFATSLHMFYAPIDTPPLGVSYREQPMLLVRGNGDFAVSHVNVTAALEIANAALTDWTLRCYDVDPRAPDLRQQLANVLCPELLQPANATVEVNDLGIARFRNFGFEFGMAGNFVSRFVSPVQAYSKPIYHSVSSTINPGRVSIFHTISSPEIRVGVPLGTVAVSVGVAGRKVYLLCLDLDKDVPDCPTKDSPRYCSVQPDSAVSNSSGVAMFEAVTVAAANSRFVNFYLLYESGYAPLLVHGRQTLSVRSIVGAVQVQGPTANLTAVERVPIEHLPTVVVVDELGRPLANKVVFATIVRTPFAACPFFASDLLAPEGAFLPAKALLGSISLPTDANGVASWHSLTFNAVAEAGLYGVQFVCEGLASPTVSFAVQSCVSHVLVEMDAPTVEFHGVPITMLPMLIPRVARILALDANGNLIEGKTATYFGFRNAATRAAFIPQVSLFLGTVSVTSGTNSSLLDFMRTGDTADLDALTIAVDGVYAQALFVSPQVTLDSVYSFVATGADLLQVPSCFYVGVEASVSVRVYNWNHTAAAGVKVVVDMMLPGGATLASTPQYTDAQGFATIRVTVTDGQSSRALLGVTPFHNRARDDGFNFYAPILATIVNKISLRFANVSAPAPGAASATFAFETVGVKEPSTLALVFSSQPAWPSATGLEAAAWTLLLQLHNEAEMGTVMFRVNFTVPGNYTFFVRHGTLGVTRSELVTYCYGSAAARLALVQPAQQPQDNLGLPYKQQPVISILGSDGQGLSGLRVVAQACDESSASFVVGSVSAGPHLDESRLLLSEPSDDLGHARFTALAPLQQEDSLNATNLLCFSLAVIDAVPVGHRAMLGLVSFGAQGQLSMLRLLTVSQEAPTLLSSSSSPQCHTPLRTPDELVIGDALLLADVICETAFVAARIEVYDASTGEKGNVQLNESFALLKEATGWAMPALTIVSGVPALYNLSLVSAKGAALMLSQFRLTDQANSLRFIVDAGVMVNRNYGVNRAVRIGKDVLTVILLTSHYNTPMNGVLVEADLDEGTINPETKYTMSSRSYMIPFFGVATGGGFALFDLTIAQARPGRHRLTFRLSGTDVAVISAPFELVQYICVDVVVPPRGNSFRLGSEGAALITDDVQLGISSLVQPVLFVHDCHGHGVPGLSVAPLLNGGESGTLFAYDTNVLSDENGTYRFRQLRIVSGRSQVYNITFECVGATSNATALRVYDTLDPDISSLSDMELVVGLSLLAAIPLMLFNSAWITSPLLVWGGFVLGMLLIAGAIIFLALTLSIPGLIAVSSQDPFLITSITLAFLLTSAPVALSLLLAYRVLRGQEHTFHTHRLLEGYTAHVRSLLVPVCGKVSLLLLDMTSLTPLHQDRG